MAIRFRCRHCQSLMSIASRRAGSIVPCATCGEDVLVPDQDEWSPPAPAPAPAPAAAESEEFVGFTAADVEWPSGPVSTPSPTPAKPERPAAAPRNPDEQRDHLADVELPAEEEGFRLPRQKPEDDEMDLTPMVDVVFQLLIFFMVTASFSLQKSIAMPTPDENKQGAAQALQPLEDLQDTSVIVEIDDNDKLLVDDEPLADLSGLADALRDRMRREQKSELVLTASTNATHRTVVAVIDAANEVGMQRIRMSAPGRSRNE